MSNSFITSTPETVRHSNLLAGATDAKVIAFPPSVSLDEFITALFRHRDEATEEVCLAQAPMDDGAPWLQQPWRAGGRSGHMTHVCISTTKPRPEASTLKRRAGDLVRAHFVYFDDVGTAKAPLEKITCAPSYLLETSPGSYHAGFILTAPVEPQWASALAKVAARAGLTDPKTADANRVGRVPGSIKPGKGYAAKLVSWHPERTYTLEELAAGLGLRWGDVEAAVRSPGSSTDQSLTVAELARYTIIDPVLAGFDRLNMLGGSIKNGYADVVCPWRHLHSKDDGATGYAPKTQSFKCFHSDGSDKEGGRTREDVVEWLKEALGDEAWRDLQLAAAKAVFSEKPLTDADVDAANDDYTPPSKTEEEAAERRRDAEVEAKKPKRQRKLIPLGCSAPDVLPPARRSICSFMAREEVTVIAGQTGAGKSAFILAAAPDLIGEKKFERTGDVLIVSKEDNIGAISRRRSAWLQRHGLTAADLKHEPHFVDDPNFTAAMCNGTRVELTEDMDWLAEQIAAIRDEGRDVCAVVLDTMTAVLGGALSENDNSMMGAAMSLLSIWAEERGVSVLLPHHTPKANGSDGGAGDVASIRGASAIGCGVRLAFTLTGLEDQQKAKLPADVRDKVTVLCDAKSSHREDDRAGRQYFLRDGQRIHVQHEDGGVVPTSVVTMAPYTPDFGWAVDSDNAKLAVLAAVAEAEKHTTELPEGNPLRVNTRGDKKGAAELIAEAEGAAASDVEKTLKTLVDARLLERARGPRSSTGNYPAVYRVTEAGAAWLEAKAAGVFSNVEVNEEEAREPVAPTPAAREPVPAQTREAPMQPAGAAPGVGTFDELDAMAAEYFAAAE